MKKYLIFLFFFIGNFGCLCDSIPFWNLEDFDIEIRGIISQPTEPVITIENDTLQMYISMIPEFVADNVGLNFSTNQLYAFSCEQNGDRGMKDPITKLEVKCLQNFAGIESGESLNDLFSIGSYRSDFSPESIEKAIENTENWTPEFVRGFTLNTTEVPARNKEYTFLIKIEMESGKVVKKHTGKIKWI